MADTWEDEEAWEEEETSEAYASSISSSLSLATDIGVGGVAGRCWIAARDTAAEVLVPGRAGKWVHWEEYTAWVTGTRRKWSFDLSLRIARHVSGSYPCVKADRSGLADPETMLGMPNAKDRREWEPEEAGEGTEGYGAYSVATTYRRWRYGRRRSRM